MENIEKIIMGKYVSAGDIIERAINNNEKHERQQDIFWGLLTDDEKDTAVAMLVYRFGNWCWDMTDIANKVINKKSTVN